MSQLKGFSERDLRLLAGFGLFVEVVLAYFLLIDGPLTKLGKSRPELALAHRTLETIETSMPQQLSRKPEPPLPLFKLDPGQSATMRIQQDLARRLGAPGVHPLSMTVAPQPVDHGAMLAYQARVRLAGPYESIMGLIATWQHPTETVSLEGLGVTIDPEASDRLLVDLAISYFTRKGS